MNHLDQYLKELFADYQNSVQNLDKMKIEILLLVSIFFRKLTDNDVNLDNADRLEQETVQRIIKCRSLNALLSVLQLLFRDVKQMGVTICANKNYLVQMANSIIRGQYKNSIKLEDIAQELHVNSSYLSRLYKKETGNSIITALNKYRIKKAKELLKSDEYRVSEVWVLWLESRIPHILQMYLRNIPVSALKVIEAGVKKIILFRIRTKKHCPHPYKS